jgi:16S rRNA (uracil1498-N3)-methyltransferase
MQHPFFYEPNITSANKIFTLSSDTFKHAIQVLRLKENDIIQITNGKGLLCKASLTSIDKKQAIVNIFETNFIERNNYPTTIAISLLKNTARFEWFLEKATELGMATIIPLICKRTEKQHFREDRMKTIVIAAMLQSQQVWLPELLLPINFKDVFTFNQYAVKLIAHCLEEDKKPLSQINTHENTIVLIGPEGDFSEDEIQLANKNNYISISLGNTRLRTETAGVATAVLLALNN